MKTSPKAYRFFITCMRFIVKYHRIFGAGSLLFLIIHVFVTYDFYGYINKTVRQARWSAAGAGVARNIRIKVKEEDEKLVVPTSGGRGASSFRHRHPCVGIIHDTNAVQPDCGDQDKNHQSGYLPHWKPVRRITTGCLVLAQVLPHGGSCALWSIWVRLGSTAICDYATEPMQKKYNFEKDKVLVHEGVDPNSALYISVGFSASPVCWA